jgi:hypothetical protein
MSPPAGGRISGEVYGEYIDRGTDRDAALWSMPAFSKPYTKAIESAFFAVGEGLEYEVYTK